MKITGDVQVSECGDEGEGWKQVGSLTSPPLSDMMNYTLQVSDNLYAETFLMHLGKSVSFISPALFFYFFLTILMYPATLPLPRANSGFKKHTEF